MIKLRYLFIAILLLSSCSSNKGSKAAFSIKDTATQNITQTNSENFYKISHHWKLISKQNKSGTKKVNYTSHDSKIVTQFETTGFFRTYDVLEIKSKDGFKKNMSLRAVGQWKIYNNQEIVMNSTLKDSAEKVDIYRIEKLTDSQLVLKNIDKDVYKYYKRNHSSFID